MSVPDNQNQLDGMEKGPAFLLHKEGFSIDDYKLIERIGEGTFGEVWKAERSGFPVALKILKTTVNSEETQRELESLDKLKKLHHKYLLHTQNFWSDGDRLFIEMELADGGSLKERLKAYREIGKNAIPEDELLKYFTEIGKALDYLHGHRPVFLHRDIKPANILLVQGSAKLADFGLLRQVSGDNSSTKTQGGTFPYMAPESIKDDRFSVHTDLFAFAVTYAELRQGSLPFPGNNQFQICQKILDDPPKLSDVFDPEERKVVLKALGKDPNERFSSCGEFVFELNRVVPWLPATTIFTFPTPPKPEPAVPASTKGSTGKPARPIDDHGTSRKNSPTTMEAIDLPPDEVSPGASTVSKKAGTVVGNTGARGAKQGTGNTTQKPPAPKASATAQAPISKPKPIPAAAPEPVLPPPPTVSKVPAKAFVTAVLLAVLVSGVTGIWFLTTRGGNDEVRKLIDEKKFSEAAKKLESATGMSHETREDLSKELEKKWWAEIPRPAAKDELALAKQKKEVQDFLTHFKSHADAKTLRDEIDARIDDGKPPPDGFHDHLTQARDKLTNKQFAECLVDLSAAKKLATTEKNRQLVNGKFQDLMDRLIKEYADQRPTKANAEAIMNSRMSLYPFLRDKNLPWTDDFRDKLDADEALALTYLGKTDASFQLYADLLRKGRNTLIQEQTVLLMRMIPKDRDFTSLVLKSGTTNVPPKELHLLNQLAAANGTNPKAQIEAVGVLIGLLNEMPAEVSKAMWPALADLEERTRSIRFEDLYALDNALAIAPADASTRKAVAQILGNVLERKVKEANYSWLANTKEKASCLAWIQRIDAPADCLLALKAECLAEPGGSMTELSEIAFPLQADWYGSYVHAVALEKKGKLPDAADVVAAKLKGKHAQLKPAARADKSVQILRGAVHSLQHKDTKQFATEADAKRAILWLAVMFDFLDEAKDDKAVDDAIALAFAAVKAADAKRLDVAGARLDKAGSATGYYWLAKAYDAEGKSQAKVLSYLDKMLDAKAPAPDALRKAAAAEGGSRALQFAKEKLKLAKEKSDNSKWNEADVHGKLGEKFALSLRKWDLPTAARFYGQAVEIQAYAIEKKSPGSWVEGKHADEMYRLFDRAIKKAHGDGSAPSDGFAVPAAIAKLGFASDLDEGKGLTKERLSATETEGDDALRVAKKIIEAQADAQEKAAWQTLRCQGIVKLADVRMHLLIRLAKDGKFDRVNDPKYVRAKFEEVRTGLELARKMKMYTEKYDGELAFKIGTMLYQVCDLPDQGKAGMKREAAQAKRELDASRKSLKESKMTLERRRETGAEAALTAIEEMLKDPGFQALLQP